MLVYVIIGCGITIGVLWILQIIRIGKKRLEKKRALEQRLKQLIFTNKKSSHKHHEN
ncbi:hypothetical protein ACIQVU_19885 [Lysinibacillus sp. NPDC098008]|uniref:hypothetical protein n=1 Tax=Lysinibacillus sp. NPDC098008 TaxID=3364146 RepID=UPI00382364CF